MGGFTTAINEATFNHFCLIDSHSRDDWDFIVCGTSGVARFFDFVIENLRIIF